MGRGRSHGWRRRRREGRRRGCRVAAAGGQQDSQKQQDRSKQSHCTPGFTTMSHKPHLTALHLSGLQGLFSTPATMFITCTNARREYQARRSYKDTARSWFPTPAGSAASRNGATRPPASPSPALKRRSGRSKRCRKNYAVSTTNNALCYTFGGRNHHAHQTQRFHALQPELSGIPSSGSGQPPSESGTLQGIRHPRVVRTRDTEGLPHRQPSLGQTQEHRVAPAAGPVEPSGVLGGQGQPQGGPHVLGAVVHHLPPLPQDRSHLLNYR